MKYKKKTSFRQVRFPQDFPWKVLDAHIQVIKPLLPDKFLEEIIGIVNRRDIDGYLDFCKNRISLQNFSYNEMKVAELRAIRSLALLQKYPFPKGADLDVPAYEKFFEAEHRCQRMNLNGFPQPCAHGDLFEIPVFEHARYFCKMVLDCSPAFLRLGKHGPGSTVSTEKQRTSIFDKTLPPFSVTPAAEPLMRMTIMADERWFRALLADYLNNPFILSMGYTPPHELTIKWFFEELNPDLQEKFWKWAIKIVENNRIATVPKNALTNRMIAIEPAGNVYLQLGVDRLIRGRLKRFGIDLDFGQSKNRSLAQDGSRSDSNSTIDLSSASDTISLSVVKYLLPEIWYDLLFALRSPSGTFDGHQVNYEKISSMGNGYTFVLESLIFSSILYGVVRNHGERWNDIIKEIAVYGDDIIVPTRFSADLMFCLRRAGFIVNSDKSFTSGYIRESCGGDYYKGMNIRPVYMSTVCDDEQDAVIIHNLLFDWYNTHLSNAWPTNQLTSLFDKYLPNMDVGPIDSDNITKWRFSYDVGMVFNSSLQTWGYLINCYEARRRRSRAPLWLRYCYLDLCNSFKYRSPPLDVLKWNEPISKVANYIKHEKLRTETDPYAIIGRNCRIVRSKRRRFVAV